MAEAEAPATSATLYAVHKHVASRCGDVSAAFMACKAADQNPEVCLKQGAAVTSCVVKLLKDVSASAGAELDAYAACLDWNSNNLSQCRKTQAEFEKACPL